MLDTTWPDPPEPADAEGGGPPSPLSDGEWRQVAILSLGVSELATLGGRVERPEIRSHLTRASTFLSEILVSYGGAPSRPAERVERGEGVMMTAIFGGQTASENDAERAVRAAMALHDRLQAYNRELVRTHIHLEMQVGIHFGWVTTFADGTVEVQDAAMTVATGLSRAAPADYILITSEVRGLLADLFHYEGLGAIYVKGSPQPIQAYRVVGINSRVEGRWQRSRLVRRSQMVGRDLELGVLQKAFADARNAATWQRIDGSSEGPLRPIVVAVCGSEGCGKSRLLYEFRRVTSPFREGAVSPLVGRAASIFPVPYAIFSELLKNLFGIRNTDPPAVRRRKLESGMPPFCAFEPVLTTYLTLLSYLVGVEPGESEVESARAFQLELRVAFTRLLRAVARHSYEVRGQPLTIFLEDLHGIHDRSQAALAAILEKLNTPVPVVIFATHRPGYRLPPEVRQLANFQELALRPLDADTQRQVIRTMLDGADLPAALEARVLEKAVGNPYYLEELLRSLVDERVLVNRSDGWQVDRAVEDVMLPATLGSLLLSRIDTLERPTRDLLLRASVVGEVVPSGVLDDLQSELQGPPAAGLLKQLEDARLLQPTEQGGEPAYEFENPLVREVSYQTLVPHNRVVLHRLVGRSIERQFASSLSDHYLELANHFRQGEDPARAASYFRLAGEKAQREYANDLALSCYTTCLNLSQDTHERRRVRWRSARVLRMLGRPDEAAAVLERLAAEIVPPLDGTYAFLAEVVLELARVRRNIGQLLESRSLCERALELSRLGGDRPGQADALVALGKCRRLQGELEGAQRAYEEALEILVLLADRAGEGVVYSNLGRLALDRGRLVDARELFEKALERQRSAEDRWGVALELGHLGEVAYAAGELEVAEEQFRRCLTQADPLDIRPLMAGCSMYLGAIAARRGERDGLGRLDTGIRIAAALQDLPRQVRGHQLKAEALEVLGMQAEAQQERLEARRIANLAGMP